MRSIGRMGGIVASAGAILILGAAPVLAQARQAQTLTLPNVSPRASVAQTVGATEIELVYHRPAVNDRELWGALVPYGQVWRTGANENTTISISTDVTVQGQNLAAGTYGVHTLPGEDEWQFIFSNDTTAWGSFSYDEEADALRVTATPEKAPHRERMSFSFEEVDGSSTTLAMRWGELRLPLKIEVDTDTVALASIREQLKGLPQFFWQGWNQAANYCLQNEINYEEALQWVDNSINVEERFNNLSTKSQLLAKTGDEEQAATVLARALEVANAGQLHNYARGQLGQGQKEEALTLFERNAERNPDVWFVELGVARGLSALGRFDEAAANMKKSLAKAPDNQKAYVQGLVDRLEKGEDIN